MGRNIAEQRTRDSHEHRGRNTLARNVANAEKQLVITNIEIEEVATYRLGWRQRTIDINIVAFWIGWEGLRQHRHLDVVGNFQLTLYRSLLGCGVAQFADIMFQRLLHVLERITQLVNLVTSMNAWQVGVEVSLSHLICRCRQLFQRL